MSETVRPQESHDSARRSPNLVRALSLAVVDDLRSSDRDIRTLSELYYVLQELHVLEERLRSKEMPATAHTDLIESMHQCNLKRTQLIDQFDRTLRTNGTNGTARIYSETPGELCDRLITFTLSIDDELPLQNDASISDDRKAHRIETVDQAHVWRSHLQECLKQTLKDVREGNAILPPRSDFKKYDNPYVNPATRKDVSIDIYAFAQRAANLKKDVQHILAVASTGHGAALSYLGRDGTLRSSVLDRWAGTKYTLLMAESERDDILHGRSPLAQEMRDLLVYSYGDFPPYRLFEAAFAEWLHWFLSGLDVRAEDIDLLVSSESHFITSRFRLGAELNRWVPNAQIATDLEHHTIHQRQAFWPSGFEKAAVLTLDTCGENLTRLGNHRICGTIARMDRSGACEVLREMIFPHSSAGLIYSIVNHHLGFTQGQEGKTMGLAPYGEPEFYRGLVKNLQLYDDGSFDFLSYKELRTALEKYEYERPKTKGAEFTQKHCDIAYAGQAIIEDIVANAFKASLRLTGRKELVYSGGLALNSVANEIAHRAARPERLYIPPNPGDAGLSLGCAFYAAYELAGWEPPQAEIEEYLGPSYDEQTLSTAARSTHYHRHRLAKPEATVARCIANGHIVARFSGEAEFGPRALGNRSILADPRRKDMKDYLNQRVKHREAFRPFAPSVMIEHASKWFDLDGRSPYMLRVVDVPEPLRELVPAIVHVDGTARVQTVDRRENERYWRLIDEFRKITGVPLILNTSFNVAGKPIVERPQAAVDCFEATDIDVLVLGDWVLSKRPLEEFENVAR